ncbi:MAG: DegV family protein [Actinomycetota bacterium]
MAGTSDFATVTDSASDVPRKYVKENGINVIPLYIHHNGKEYRDGVDITSNKIYRLQKEENAVFKSSSPSPKDFYRLYSELLQTHKKIISVHISSKLSAVINSARIAARMLNAEDRIIIYDSFAGTMGCGLMAIAAAKSVLKGYALEKIIAKLDFLKENIRLYGTIDTLKYLRLSGRVPALANIISSALKIKPILGIKNGIVGMAGISITRYGSLTEITRRVIRHFKKEKWVVVSIVHSLSLQEAEKIKQRLTAALNCVDFTITECTPVVGAHTGPGLIGIIVSKLDQDLYELFRT